jgi:hypothetical protein
VTQGSTLRDDLKGLDLAPLRSLLGQEPVICDASLGVEVPAEAQTDQFELPGIIEPARADTRRGAQGLRL